MGLSITETLIVFARSGWDHTHSAANDEYPFLFSPDPLNNLVRTLSQCITACIWSSDTIHLKERCHPSQGHGIVANAMMYFEMRVLRVDVGVKVVVQG